MEIVTNTTITLTQEEKEAIQTIIDARNICICNDCYECNVCPLNVDGECIGDLCMVVKERIEK